MAALVALLSSLLWGTGDFLGGRATRTWGALRVLVWSQVASFLLMWAVVLGAGLPIDLDSLLIAAGGGVAGVTGLAAFYRALAAGPMALVPPLAATGVALPVAVGLATGEAPTALAVAGLLVAVAGVVLAAGSDSVGDAVTRIAPSTLGLCAIAAVGFAIVFVALDASSGSSIGSAVVGTAGVRLGSFLTLLVASAAARLQPWRGVGPSRAAEFACIGVFDTGANLLFAIATTLGSLEVVAVLGSLYPAVTSGLAFLVLGDRIGRRQLLGVMLALVGVAVLAAR